MLGGCGERRISRGGMNARWRRPDSADAASSAARPHRSAASDVDSTGPRGSLSRVRLGADRQRRSRARLVAPPTPQSKLDATDKRPQERWPEERSFLHFNNLRRTRRPPCPAGRRREAAECQARDQSRRCSADGGGAEITPLGRRGRTRPTDSANRSAVRPAGARCAATATSRGAVPTSTQEKGGKE
jgi:hypothetical protein